MNQLSDCIFANSFVNDLPGDQKQNRESHQVLESCYSLINPEPVTNPKLIAWSDDLAQNLNLEQPHENSESLKILSGNHIPNSSIPFAYCYGGHQFGRWAGQLGDGRAITLGELNGKNNQTMELQLKGAGRTPYSRRGDGRAVLRSSFREFIASEAMHHLGVPTTRALSLVTTGDLIERDMFYNGNIHYEIGAITSRLAPTFVRFGNFEIFFSRNDITNLKKLADWTIKRFFPSIDSSDKNSYQLWFNEVCVRTAKMIIEWERVGFTHGVMNTDNMSILGLTIDYGPFGWLDSYDPNWTPNTTDLPGRRYAFGNQPSIALWNLERLAHAISPLVENPQSLETGLKTYVQFYNSSYQKMIAEKLGIINLSNESDQELISDLFQCLQMNEIDYTLFFRKLSDLNVSISDSNSLEHVLKIVEPAFYTEPSKEFNLFFQSWLNKYLEKIRFENTSTKERKDKMDKVNPKFIPRNYILFNVIQDLEKNQFDSLNQLIKVILKPYAENEELEHLALKRPGWAKDTPGCSTLSCSS